MVQKSPVQHKFVRKILSDFSDVRQNQQCYSVCTFVAVINTVTAHYDMNNIKDRALKSYPAVDAV